MTRERSLRGPWATAIGFCAILMWSTLALLTTHAGNVPPLQLTAMAFSIASLIGVLFWIKSPIALRAILDLPLRVWLLGVGGLFGFHLFYFVAMSRAPAVEASLITYLWPLLMVLMSSILPGERLHGYHIAGALIGLAGTAILLTGGQQLALAWEFVPGYLAAFMCALTWSTYSVLSRLWGAFPTSAVGAFCIVTAALSWICHGSTEVTVWPSGWQWAAVAGLGLGPVGLAFFVWDHGVKHGNIRVLGVMSYLAPLLSTLLLVVAGRAAPSWQLGISCVLIVGGAVVASGRSRVGTAS